MSYEEKFKALSGLPAQPTVPPNCNYVLYKKIGNQLIISGNGPLNGGTIPGEFTGKLGKEVGQTAGYQAARLTAMNLLLVAQEALGTLDKVEQILSVDGFVNCTPEFNQQPAVINGCSDLLIEIFGDHGKHTRSAIGSVALAFDICVEIGMTLQFKH